MKSLIPALVKFQQNVPTIPKTCVNPFFSQGGKKAMYADLATVIESCMPTLNKHELAVSQTMGFVAGVNTLKTTLFHSSGEFITSEIALPEINDAQKLTGAITYLRRSMYLSILGLVADDDQDGNDVPGTKPQETKTAPTQKQIQSAGTGEQMTGPKEWKHIEELSKRKGVTKPFVKTLSDYTREVARLNSLPDAN